MTSYSTNRITETMRLVLFITISVLVFRFYLVTPIPHQPIDWVDAGR